MREDSGAYRSIPSMVGLERLKANLSVGDSDAVRIPFCARQLFGSLRQRTSVGQVEARELVQLDGMVPP